MVVPTEIVRLPAGRVQYRLSGDGERTVFIEHGAHLSAALPIGEREFLEAGLRVLVASRPGYGRTPVSAGRTRRDWAQTTVALCEHLGIDRLAAVVGVSHGGPSAITLAATHPQLVERVILQCALSSLPWPDPLTRMASAAGFNGMVEPWFWLSWRFMMDLDPRGSTARAVGAFSTHDGEQVLRGWTDEQYREFRALIREMRSGQGFLHDLAQAPSAADEESIRQPTLIVATEHDGQLPISHAQRLQAAIPGSRLYLSPALSHFIWYGPGREELGAEIRRHLDGPGLRAG